MSKQEFEQNPFTFACQVENYSYIHPFTDTWALKDIDFAIEPGKVIAVFGDSGSGKTTLFSSVGGLNHHFYKGGKHHGRIELFGDDVAAADIFQLARHYGLVTQDFRNQLLADQVASAIAFPMENQAVPYQEIHRRVGQLLDMMGLSDLRERKVTQLSGGEGQAVVIASMLAKEPQMMIFDDIASDLDQRGQAKIRSIIKELKQQGITMFVVDSSSPQWLLGQIADRVLLLNKGRQEYFGPPQVALQDKVLIEQIGLTTPQIEFREAKNSPVAVSTKGVDFSYDGKLAVKGVSCEISEGSITGIIGHNGSGKTTLAKMMAGLYKPTSGQIRINGIEPYSLPAEQIVRQVAYLPQSTAGMFFTGAVTQELNYTPKAIGSEPIITPEMIGLSNLGDEHPESLSTGQRQRLALGCALSSDPEILILDEPTKGLNQKERLVLTEQLKDLQNRGKTTVVISHDWPLIARTTNNVLVMDQGQLVCQGPTEKVLQDRNFFDKLGLSLPW